MAERISAYPAGLTSLALVFGKHDIGEGAARAVAELIPDGSDESDANFIRISKRA